MKPADNKHKRPLKSMAVIGAGASSLALASFIDTSKYDVVVYEKNSRAGRKFLVAGKGGFNLTHSESMEEMKKKYLPSGFLNNALDHFTNDDFRTWLKSLGIETFVGSSKRVFPLKGIKPIEVLNSIHLHLEKRGVKFQFESEVVLWNNKSLVISSKGLQTEVQYDVLVFSLGGASWAITGSDASWQNMFIQNKINIIPFEPSNCAFKLDLPVVLKKRLAGEAIKNATFTCGAISRPGEAVITEFGMEGSGVYPLSPEVRKQLKMFGTASIYIDFKPDLNSGEVFEILDNSVDRSVKEKLQRLKLKPAQIELIKSHTSKEEYHSPKVLSQLIKKFPLTVTALAPIDEAISTVGGVDLNELDQHFQLIKYNNVFCMGEMLDWDAPTGGYLLQACFSMGKFLADHINSLN